MQTAIQKSEVSPSHLLRRMLQSPEPVVLVGAHNGLSARLVERAGFDGIWASGFEISAAHGVPDASILTMAESLEAAREMARAVRIPIVADCDNGFGNAINVIRTVQEYEAAGIAGICIEDNVFPKRCSFYVGTRRELVSVDEHAGKVSAAKAAARTDDFVIIARTEALIAGWGMEEALRRGRAYADAGADLVLIHSKTRTPDEVLEFARRWDRPQPLVAVPTIYRDATVDALAEGGIKVVIFANHALRSALKAISENLAVLREKRHAGAIDDRIAPLQDVYELVGVPEMKRQEGDYLPRTEGTSAIVLAAGGNPAEGRIPSDRPRAMLEVGGTTVLARQVAALNAAGIEDVAVVRGHEREAVQAGGARFFENPQWAETGELASLWVAIREVQGPFLCAYGDILFEPWVIERLLRSPDDITIAMDRRSIRGLPHAERARRDLVSPTALPDLVERILTPEVRPRVRTIGHRASVQEADTEFIGLVMFSSVGAKKVRDACDDYARRFARAPFQGASSFRRASIPDLLQQLVDDGHEVACVEVQGGWIEIDSLEDWRHAWSAVRG